MSLKDLRSLTLSQRGKATFLFDELIKKSTKMVKLVIKKAQSFEIPICLPENVKLVEIRSLSPSKLNQLKDEHLRLTTRN